MNARRRSDAACPDCDRRGFLKAAAGVALAAQGASLLRAEEAKPVSTPENAVKALYDSLSEQQKKDVCFAWDYVDPNRGLLRTRISNNWNITKPTIIDDDYYTKEQRGIIRDIFEGLIQPEWHARIDKQLDDDAGGFGHEQSFAIFGQPGTNQFEFVMTGRHMTLRCDGNSSDHVAFGGPIFYGHAASGFDEEPGHPGNVFWEQAIAANDVYKVLDGKQRERAAVPATPSEAAVQFQGKEGKFPGLPVAEMTSDQKEAVQKTLQKLIEPYRQSDRDEVLACLRTQGGLDACSLAFYTDHDLGEDKVWDNWRLEGPSFVWYFRGYPHVHCWVNVASSPEPKLNA